ncbi:MAG: MMPL family transporter, partial [Spirochaetaceae bacterium]|nr:MMPL family transporter [Spirochaetaceae bacterium]
MKQILRHPRAIIAVTAGITLFFLAQLPRVRLDNNNLRFVPQDDHARITSAWIEETFGSSLFVLVGLERTSGTVFEPAFLERIRDYTMRVEEMAVVGDVNSLMTTDYITGDSDTILVEGLVPEDFTGTPGEIAEMKRRLSSWDMYRRTLISDDFTATQIYVPLTVTAENMSDPEVAASYLQIRDSARQMWDGVADVYVTGMPVISGTINEAMHADLRFLVPLVILVVLLIEYVSLRSMTFVLLSLVAVFLAVIWAVGAMPLFGIKLSIISTVLPVILIAVGNSYGLHVIIHYMEDYKEETGRDFVSMSRSEHTQYILRMMENVTAPIFLAATTTAVSFFSFCFTTVIPVREFGYFSGFGVLATLVIAVTLTPAILILRGPRSLRVRKQTGTNDSRGATRKIAGVFTAVVLHKRTVLGITAGITLLALWGTSKVVSDNVFMEYFRPDTDIVRSDEFIRRKFAGSKTLSIVARADTPDALLRPASLGALDRLETYLNSDVPEVGKVMGFTDLVKRVNQVFSDDPSYYEIPLDPIRYGFEFADDLWLVVSNYLMLLSGDIGEYANDALEPTAIKLSVQLRTTGQRDTIRAVAEIRNFAAVNFPPDIEVIVGGTALVEASTNDRVVQSLWSSMIIALVSLFMIVTVCNRSAAAGIIAVLPLCVLILVNFAVMGFAGIKLNIGTAMIASVSMGIGIDYTIHYLEAYKREVRQKAASQGTAGFLRRIYLTSGIAIITDAVSTGAGFGVLLFSHFTMLADLGLLIAL